MAVVTGFTYDDRPVWSQVVQSDNADPQDTVELTGLPRYLSHIFVSVQFFDASGFPAAATAGILTLEVRTQGNSPNWEPAPIGTFDAVAPATLSWEGNIDGVRIVPSGLAGVDHWKVHVSMNQS